MNQIRLAFRQEGVMWNAYIARMESMDGAAIIGSISMDAISGDDAIKKQYIALMKTVLTKFINQRGQDVTGFIEQAAPEHERAGNA